MTARTVRKIGDGIKPRFPIHIAARSGLNDGMKTFIRAVRFRTVFFMCAVSILHGSSGSVAADEGADRTPVLFMIGDSTMANKPLNPAQPERGWGQLLPLYFKEAMRIDNRAVNGRSSKSFRDEGRWKPVLDRLQPGDFVIIQFGHNDEKRQDPKRFAEPFGTFRENLARYVRETRAAGGIPILATPIARRAFDADGTLRDTHGDYPAAVRKVAAEMDVPLLDLERSSSSLIRSLGPDHSKKMFMWYEPGEFESLPQGREDNTHLNAYGACRICDLAMEEIGRNVPDLARWRRN